jgi:alanine racemase
VTVDLAAVRDNARAVKGLVGEGRYLWAVVKADAYGHGAIRTARAALAGGADGLAVACLAEAAQLRRAGVSAPILHLAAGEPRRAGRVLELDLVQCACTEEMVRALSRAAQRRGRAARVHVKVDTGMGRLGVSPERAASLARLASELPGVRMEGVFSHLATAEAEDPTFALRQQERFARAVESIAAAGVEPGMRHLANSAAALRFGVRTGLLVYGILPDAEIAPSVELRPALCWHTRVAFLHRVPAGSPISYGGTYVTTEERLVGVLPVGYADGYPRHASNRAQVLLRGRECPVIGVVCMDHVMIDATPAAGPEVGDEVTLLGRQGKAAITANQLAAWAGTVVHETPTVIGRRVQRVYLDSESGAEGESR